MIERLAINVGCDPELFIKKNGSIIGSEKILPKNGLAYSTGKIIIDGVQAELNPAPSYCRVFLGGYISDAFKSLKQILDKDNTLSLDFTTSVTVDPKEMDTLSPENKVLGCTPSKSIYGRVGLGVKDVKAFFDRSLGGHIHLSGGEPDADKAIRNYEKMVAVMDILVGNTCVLLDRNTGNVIRRKTYGRAGEYRTPEHGIEYRTLSSFWLKSYQLMSMVMGLSKQAVCIVASDHCDEFIASVDMDKIKQAINDNNFDLAMSNFNSMLPKLLEITPSEESTGYHDNKFSLTSKNISDFFFFVEKGIDYWFKEDPLTHWIKFEDVSSLLGFERFLLEVVRKENK